MTVKYPLAEHRLPLVKGQIPVLSLFHHRLAAGDGTDRVDKFLGAERRATSLTLVSISPLVAAMRAFSYYVAVGKKLPRLLVVKLHRGLLYKLAFFIETLEKFRSRF